MYQPREKLYKKFAQILLWFGVALFACSDNCERTAIAQKSVWVVGILVAGLSENPVSTSCEVMENAKATVVNQTPITEA